jgi:hypothetical protein
MQKLALRKSNKSKKAFKFAKNFSYDLISENSVKQEKQKI